MPFSLTSRSKSQRRPTVDARVQAHHDEDMARNIGSRSGRPSDIIPPIPRRPTTPKYSEDAFREDSGTRKCISPSTGGNSTRDHESDLPYESESQSFSPRSNHYDPEYSKYSPSPRRPESPRYNNPKDAQVQSNHLPHANSYSKSTYPVTPVQSSASSKYSDHSNFVPLPLKVGLQKRYAGIQPIQYILPGPSQKNSREGHWLRRGTLRQLVPLKKKKGSFWKRTKSTKARNMDQENDPAEEPSGFY